jgi:hypothetical protein
LQFLSQCTCIAGISGTLASVKLYLPAGKHIFPIGIAYMPWLTIIGPAANESNNGFIGGAFGSGLASTAIVMGGTTDGARTVSFTVGTTSATLISTTLGAGLVGAPMGVQGLTGTNVAGLSGVYKITSVNTAAGTITCNFLQSTNAGANIPAAACASTLFIPAAWISTAASDVSNVGFFTNVGFGDGSLFGNTVSQFASPTLARTVTLTNTIFTSICDSYGPITLFVVGEFFAENIGIYQGATVSMDGYSGVAGVINIGGGTQPSGSKAIIIQTCGRLVATAATINFIDALLTVDFNSFALINSASFNAVYALGIPQYLTVTNISRVVFMYAATLTAGSTSVANLAKNTLLAADGSYWKSP